MRWPWSKKPKPAPAPLPGPALEGPSGSGIVELLPGLSVSVSDSEYECYRGRVLTWEIITNGLMEVGQKELWISIVQSGRALEDLIAPMLEFIRAVHEMAKQGNTVDVGGSSSLSPESSPLVGGSHFRAAIYTYPIGVGTDEHAIQSCLSMICLRPEELEVAQEFGHTRVLSALGNYYRYFPTPPWADPDRPVVLKLDALEESIVGKTMRIGLYHSSSIVTCDESDREHVGYTGDLPDHSASWKPDKAWLLIHPHDKPLLVAALDASEGKLPITMLTSITPGVTRSMVWTGSAEPMQVISDMHAPGFAIGCNFTTLVSEAEETGAAAAEDGLIVHLTPAGWKDLDAAVRSGSAFSVEGENDFMDFELVWMD